ncbi:MAG: hypothetical protein HKN25_13140, partial [Pyrinomonadaceae bacterium]|nr:hypothetical protein [Pyrinomonadaceae bacterium]
VEDFSLENADLRTARWYYDMLAVFSKSKLIHEHHPHVDDPLKAWEDEHRHDPPLNESREMINEIGEGFSNYLVETNPYLYRSICSSLPNDEFGYDLTETVLEMERSLIREGAVSPVGTRIIAKNL